MLLYNTIYASAQPNQLDLTDNVTLHEWPEFMLNDPVANKYWGELYTKFPDYQFSFTDKENGEIVAVANSIPLHYDGEFKQFPKEGWDFILQKGMDDYNNKVTPNILSALSITINSKYRAKGISNLVIKEMIKIGKEKKHSHLIAPVRPNLKPLYPLIPIEEYIHWRDSDGKLFDAWLRVHESIGGKIIKVCYDAMKIPGTVSEWEKWAKMKFPATGKYTVDGALVPISIDRVKNEGLYIEPNVLVVHKINSSS